MNAALIEGVLRAVLGSRRKRSRNALHFLTGGRRGSLVNADTLLAAAGVAWGIFETLQGRAGQAPPPLPNNAAAPAADETMRMLRLAISAAMADGSMSEHERAAIVEQARAEGAEGLVASELERPRALQDIVAGVADPAHRATLYVLAFTILRADEEVTGPERIYLARLASLLELDPVMVQTLETNTAARIDASAEAQHPGPPQV